MVVNGKYDENEYSTIAQLLELKKIDPRKVIVELNGELVEKENFSEIKLNNEDKIEILKFVGGG